MMNLRKGIEKMLMIDPFKKTGRAEEINEAQKEETDGLERFYNEIAPPETLERNFKTWEAHLNKLLQEKYPDPVDLKLVIEKATEYARTLPICHGTKYEAIRKANISNFSSKAMFRVLRPNTTGWGYGNTCDFDNKHELDHFVYCFLGNIPPKENDLPSTFDTQAYINNDVLEREGTLVALEDWAWGTKRRLGDHAENGLRKRTSFDEEEREAFNVHLQQIWTGENFVVLFPLMLACAYDDPHDYDRRRPFPKNVVPEGLPPLTHFDKCQGEISDFPNFEIRIPQKIATSDILSFAVDSSAFEQTPTEKNLIIVPTELSVEEKREFVRKKLAELRGKH
jgi:hypothetical protein